MYASAAMSVGLFGTDVSITEVLLSGLGGAIYVLNQLAGNADVDLTKETLVSE